MVLFVHDFQLNSVDSSQTVYWEAHSLLEVRRRFAKTFPNAVRTPSVQAVKYSVLTELVERNEVRDLFELR